MNCTWPSGLTPPPTSHNRSSSSHPIIADEERRLAELEERTKRLERLTDVNLGILGMIQPSQSTTEPNGESQMPFPYPAPTWESPATSSSANAPPNAVIEDDGNVDVLLQIMGLLPFTPPPSGNTEAEYSEYSERTSLETVRENGTNKKIG
ncbi:hypothetical protein BT69DRAFT_132271 [Atractiella rhizophila]|nr:hypothetical protein BT69DRAFT_132271 [Atractiella rhizophila]